jgi:hypothetical protein
MYNNEHSSVLQEVFMEMEAPKPPPPKVRQFICSATDLKSVRGLTKATATEAELKAVIETAVKTIVQWVWNASAKLRVSPRSANTIKIFKSIFVKDPGWIPPWKPRKTSWVDFGDLIAVRILRAAEILNGGHIKFYCYGSTTYCPECTGSPSTYDACSSWGKVYRICLGDSFWQVWKSGKPADMDYLALTLLHEALHIYFGKTVGHEGWSGNSYCYQRFVAEMNGIAVPASFKSRCHG